MIAPRDPAPSDAGARATSREEIHESAERAPDDLPRWLAVRRRGALRAARVVIALSIVVQVADVARAMLSDDADAGAWWASPWLPLAMLYGSAAAIGVEATLVGVRAAVGRGPSIRNLAPGGWAWFAAMAWIVAVPAYAFGARRAHRRRLRGCASPAGHHRSVGFGDAFAIATVAAMAVACACAAVVSALDTMK